MAFVKIIMSHDWIAVVALAFLDADCIQVRLVALFTIPSFLTISPVSLLFETPPLPPSPALPQYFRMVLNHRIYFHLIAFEEIFSQFISFPSLLIFLWFRFNSGCSSSITLNYSPLLNRWTSNQVVFILNAINP